MTRKTWINQKDKLSMSRQCALARVSRTNCYRRPKKTATSKAELVIRGFIDEKYTQHPFCGSRRMVLHLAAKGCTVNRKRVQRIMGEMGLAGMAPGPNTSKAEPNHKVYPYLLRGVPITRVNQVWSTDITYVRLEKGFAYLVAVIDWYSRNVLSWRISNSMDASFCVASLKQAIAEHGKPEIFNSDQGSQFTSAEFVEVLQKEEIVISMDGRGRAFDNIFVERLWRSVKYEDVYLHGYSSMTELRLGLKKYFEYYNTERPHQALANQTPSEVYQSGVGGGAIIVDKYPRPIIEKKTGPQKMSPSGQRCSAVC